MYSLIFFFSLLLRSVCVSWKHPPPLCFFFLFFLVNLSPVEGVLLQDAATSHRGALPVPVPDAGRRPGRPWEMLPVSPGPVPSCCGRVGAGAGAASARDTRALAGSRFPSGT